MTTKIIFTAVCLTLLMTSASRAQLIAESFNYPDGDSIGAHGWVHFSPTGTGTLNRIMVTTPGLEFPGFQFNGIGNAASVMNSGQDSYKPLSEIKNSESVYTFFLVNFDTVRSTGDYFCAYLPSASVTSFLCRVYARKMQSSSEKFAFGLSKTTTTGGIQWSDTIYSKETTYLLVMKYTFNTSSNTDDEVSLFIFSEEVPSSEPAPTIGPLTGTGTDGNDIGRFALRQGAQASAPNFRIDEIFTGTGWSSVLPVELSSFSSYVNGRDVTLFWDSKKEINNAGFDIERATIPGIWVKIGFVNGYGYSNSVNYYSYTDRGLPTGKYFYRLKQTDLNGNYEYFNLNNEVSVGIPVKYELSQNYPNPFNPSTNINFDLPSDGYVSLKIFDMSGKEIMALVNEVKTAGYYSINFNASGLSSGIYYYTISADNFKASKKMLLLK
ncbi:MAG TPA: T9SS type A sorting domain-containing protein [Ignavibacteria bacterium]|mgnify:CR=1 FL=1|nr:T9SS type A sorting domain-containing protein [Ignavibacteria bacterium]HRK00259.1 T9SS type A sorting domain-containing protein [Ignavibacteria bacterium]